MIGNVFVSIFDLLIFIYCIYLYKKEGSNA